MHEKSFSVILIRISLVAQSRSGASTSSRPLCQKVTELAFRAVCWLATGFYVFAQAIAIESLLAFAVFGVVVVFIALVPCCAGGSTRGAPQTSPRASGALHRNQNIGIYNYIEDDLRTDGHKQ